MMLKWYKKGCEMYLADTLSRAFLPTTGREKEFDKINMVDYLPIRPERLSEIKRETEKDDVLQSLKSMILDGWPENICEIPPFLKSYFSIRDELAVQNGLIFKGSRVIIPFSLRNSIKEAVHSSH